MLLCCSRVQLVPVVVVAVASDLAMRAAATAGAMVYMVSMMKLKRLLLRPLMLCLMLL